ncbi:MAG: hypothetical protein QM504_04250 [Pseudomonadota bacterium]
MENEIKTTLGKRVLKSVVWSPYLAYKFIIIMIRTFPVALILGISAIVMNPAILAKSNYNVLKVILENYNTVFMYGIWFSIIFAIGIMLLNPFERFTKRIVSKI